MTRPEALKALSSDEREERLVAAQTLERIAIVPDRELIEASLKRETVVWVKSALEATLRRLEGQAPCIDRVEEKYSDRLSQPTDSAAVEQLTRLLVHELNPIIGRLETRATLEFEKYGGSQTQAEVKRLQDFMTSLEILTKAAQPAKIDKLDLTELIAKSVEATRMEYSALPADAINVAQTEQIIVNGNAFLLDLIIANGLRNAIEALTRSGGLSIVLNWGAVDSYTWLSILDDGPGLQSDMTNLTIPHQSSKGDQGMGLFIASRAAKSLDGELSLKNASGGGALYYFSWPPGLRE